nr:methylenetetrahydrofolate reductase [Brachybacterium sacelli]
MKGITDRVEGHLPPGARVTVTASPAQGLAATIAVAGELAAAGFTAIPHLAARQIRDRHEATDLLEQLAAAGVHEVFVIAGDATRPAGDYTGSLGLLEDLAAAAPGITLGMGAHPEGHPFVDEQEAIRLVRAKAEHASYLVTQMCFEAPPLLQWVRSLREAGITLPIRPGIAAPVGTARLLRIGAKVGVGRSLRMLSGRGSGMRRLVGPGEWDPDALLAELARGQEESGLALAGPHVYTFNDLEAVARWRAAA